MTKMIGLANSCKECPHRHYYSSGAYECAIVQNSRLNADNTIPGWCPLPDYPSAAPVADSAMAKFAGLVLKDHRNDGYPGDVDGGSIQQWALDSGLIEVRTVYERCGENCSCAEFVGADAWLDGVECFFTTDAGKAAIAAAERKEG
ncbi:hypothetical protein SAMN04487926_12121 [Paraburkholderia steynii]|uniref:Uncharacterized protein n=1 Tax=Paraburkholderia steynii TaxID=1245441 RepID=A0A7Z7BBX0_9BURK|nr:hypothetical protein [Paraburkholderia steynii]SDI64587.1 hypothetical protein SAMN04487926_12121 [Paraburkholderia steynii]